ncbi:NRDE domain-containing protein [Trichoderma evansii]
MCIVIFTTAHPDYSLILIDNRDEFILRPTSRPHWWTHPESGSDVLSSRDLQRAAKGTWLGITKTGNLAVLTNYREADSDDAQHPVHGIKSRGRMVNMWLGGLPDEGVMKGVDELVQDGGVKGVGGFSMVCSKLKRNHEGIAIVSNRAADVKDVPLVGLEPDGVWGLSNTVYNDPNEWPKVTTGKRLLKEVVAEAAAKKSTEDDLIASLFSVLDTESMPERPAGSSLQEYMNLLKHTIFVPPIGDELNRVEMEKATAKGRILWADLKNNRRAVEELKQESRPGVTPSSSPHPPMGFEEGMYGTQRQTVMLVDNEGNTTYVERALWDANGNEIPRGEGDVVFRFKIEGWDE